MNPSVWGPATWDLLFGLSYRCKETHCQDLCLLYRYMEYVLPCDDCRTSLTEYRKLVTCKLCEKTPETCVVWLWTVHDLVNQKLGKICVSLDDLTARHTTLYATTSEFAIWDVLSMMTLTCAPRYAKIMLKTIRTVTKLSDCAYPHYQLGNLASHASWTDNIESLVQNMFDTHVKLCESRGAKVQTRSEWIARLKCGE